MNTELIHQIPLEQIRPSEGNRKYGGFDPAKLQELADSIRAAGVLQPVLVRTKRECDPSTCRHLEGMREECGVDCCRKCNSNKRDNCNAQCTNWDKKDGGYVAALYHLDVSGLEVAVKKEFEAKAKAKPKKKDQAKPRAKKAEASKK